jgi:hypothetical protein
LSKRCSKSLFVSQIFFLTNEANQMYYIGANATCSGPASASMVIREYNKENNEIIKAPTPPVYA